METLASSQVGVGAHLGLALLKLAYLLAYSNGSPHKHRKMEIVSPDDSVFFVFRKIHDMSLPSYAGNLSWFEKRADAENLKPEVFVHHIRER